MRAPDCACGALELLDLSRNRIGAGDVGASASASGGAALAFSLAGHPSLHTINLRANPLGAADAAALAHMVAVALSLPPGRCPLRSVAVADGAEWRTSAADAGSGGGSNLPCAGSDPLQELRQALANLADRDGAWGQEQCVRLAAEAERMRRAEEAATQRKHEQRERSWTQHQLEEQGQRR